MAKETYLDARGQEMDLDCQYCFSSDGVVIKFAIYDGGDFAMLECRCSQCDREFAIRDYSMKYVGIP